MALLGQKIAESIFNTAPEPDPENVFDDDTIAKNELIDTGIDVEINTSRLRDIDLGESYSGKVISRKQLNEWNNNDIDIDYNNDNISDNDSDLNYTQELRIIPEIESSDNNDIKIQEEEEDEFDTLFEDENEELNNSMNKNEFNEFSSMMNKQMDKADKLQNNEIIINKKDIKPHSFQLKKANAVAAQTKLYDKIATLRIHLQKPFLTAQKLPRPSVHCELFDDINNNNNNNKCEERNKLKRLFSELSNKSLELADKIMDLQSELLDKNDDYPNELRHRKRRRLNKENDINNDINFNELWQEQNEDWSDFIPYCNKTMDIWDKKMKLVEDYSSKKNNKNKNNQSLLERIALIIENPQRILHKMQSVDKLFKMYGDNDIGNNNNNNNMNDENNNNNGLRFEKYRMECEVFNDSQFYRRMLKEIIDIGHTASLNRNEVHRKMDEIQYEKQKQKMEFHKAKLRMKYTIRPDMENFMAPIYNHDHDFPVEQLYNSLFQ